MALEYDCLIVGARVAGASLALQLGERGRHVLMVDRDSFPSDTLSTHFAGAAMLSLHRLGVLGDVEAVGFRRLTRSRTWVEDCLFEGPIGPGGAYAMAPRRDALDSILIRHACERGAVEFRQRTRAEGLIEEDGRVVGAMLRMEGGERREVRARVVVGADGKYSNVAEWVKAERYHETPGRRPVYYGYYHGVAPLPEAALEISFTQNRIGFLFPMRPDEDCLALELQPEEFDSFRSDPQAAFERHYRALPGMAERMRGATLEGKLQGMRAVDNFFRKPYGPGWALVGDAGYLKDPSTGLGIGDALEQSFPLAAAIDATLDGADWETTMSGFQVERDQAMLPRYHFTLAATDLHDAPPETLAWMRGSLMNPHFVRQLMYLLPSVLSTAPHGPLHSTARELAAMWGGTETDSGAAAE